MTSNKTIIISGYQILCQVYESANSEVYRGKKKQDHQPVILKVLKEDYPTTSELTRYKQEYEIIRNLNIDGVIKAYSLEPYQRTLVIILEDFGALSLKQWMNHSGGAYISPSLSEFLGIAIKTTEILGQIHAANIIHKDINPANIVFNPETKQLKIIDFGISTQLTRENPTVKNPNVLEGTLAYMSPEQTGRMNRSLDYRTDFYSLGVTFYELLTEKLPFETRDALELVHCHIAKQPIAPHQLVAAQRRDPIPQAVSDIIMKLMAKTAEDRYQSAWGIKADLEECLNQLQAKGEISDFPLGNQDISNNFQIPQKLYGREAEVETLLQAFDRVATPPQSPLSQEGQGGIEMMLVAGYSGIGKSALVAEVHKPITEKRGYFISGKFDQFQRNIPYSAVVDAFAGLVRQLLTESDAQLAQWRAKLLAAVGSNGQVIIDVIPEVKLIIGKQPTVAELRPSESQNRFNFVFQKFIRSFCTKEHPLVIFLDDLQWADSATLKLIELMIADTDSQYLFLIGAYRDNEVNPSHPLMMTIDGLNKAGATVNQITLTPLKLNHISQLIADTLHSDTTVVNPLAKLVMLKTSGNPFFVNQFLTTLYHENLITFQVSQSSFNNKDVRKGFWQWHISQIEAQDITDNVVDLMIAKLRKLPESTQRVLKLAACIGSTFDLDTISLVCEQSQPEIFLDLKTAIQSGLILAVSDFNQELLIQDYKFLHDRVQQAAYALLQDNEKAPIHLQIGRLLLANTTTEELNTCIFDIVNQLNGGQLLIEDEGERIELAELNLQAGEKAKSSIAYQPAAEYLETGIKLLSENTWENYHNLTFKLYQQYAESQYLLANFDRSNQICHLLLEKAISVAEKMQIFHLQIVERTSKVDYAGSIEKGFEALKLLEIEVPSPNNSTKLKKAFQSEMDRYQKLLGSRTISDLKDLPEMTDWRAKEVLRVCISISDAAILSNPLAFNLASIIGINFSLEYGNDVLSAPIYTFMGIIFIRKFRDYRNGYDLAAVGMGLTEEKVLSAEINAKTIAYWSWNINHWMNHARTNLQYGDKTFQNAIETNDIIYAAYGLIVHPVSLLLIGAPLEEVLAATERCISYVVKHQRPFHEALCEQIRRLIFCLQGKTYSHGSFEDEIFNEAAYLETWKGIDVMVGHYWIRRLQALYTFERYGEALTISGAEIEQQVPHPYIPSIQFHFYYSLTILAVLNELSDDEKPEYLKILKRNRKLIKNWAENCEDNFLHKHLLIEAEIAKNAGQMEEALSFYERAIASANKHGFVQNEALGNELLAKFWLEKGQTEIAQIYLKKARYGYQLWGAEGKVENLEAKYPQLLSKSSGNRLTDTQTTTSSIATSNRSGEALDLATVMKASQAISGEIMLDKLLAKLMKILIENAGAQTGFLLLDKTGSWVIEAAGNVDTDNVTVLQSISLEQNLPKSIVNYVTRTRETVVENDAAQEGKFTRDIYIKTNKSKSILCAPLINQGQLSGIVYLENNLTTRAFTPDRLAVLQLLSGQAAIAITNAKLYTNLQEFNENLEELVEQRTAELKATQKKLVESEKMASLGGLVAGVAHEINTPVGIGITAASLLADKTTEFFEIFKSGQMKRSQLEKFLDTAIQSSSMVLSNLTRAADLISSFKQVAVDQSTEEERTFNLKEYLSDVLISLRPKLKTTYHQVEIRGDEAISVHTYPGALAQIITNLVINSLTHAYSPEDTGHLVFDFKQEEKEIILVYSDDGKGIPPENLRKIFDPFFTTKRGQGGSGLGLHIVYNLVTQKLNGTIECESQVGDGTRFMMKLLNNL